MNASTTEQPISDQEGRRREALQATGWGARFHFLQLHNACFWIYLLLVGAGLRVVLNMALPSAGLFAAADTAAIVTAGLFCFAFLLVLHHVDRWERTPAKLALVAFLGGGLAAPWAMALPGNGAMMTLYAKIFGQSFAADWQAGLTAPFVEETAKGAMFLLLLGLAPVVIRTVYDGLIVGAYVGLGFQVLEDMLYGQNSAFSHFGVDQAGSVLHTFAMRAATGVASHALYTALFGAGLIYLIGTVAQPRRVGRGLALVLAAMVFHGVWDSTAALAGGQVYPLLALLLVMTVLPVLVLILAVRLGANRERGYARAVLAPEVANGTITHAELDAVAGDRSRRRRDRKAALANRPSGTSRRHERQVLRAIHDLLHDLAASGGEDDENVQHARDEIQRLRG